MSTLRFQRFVRTSLWLLPLGCLAAGALLAVGTLAVDQATDYRLVSQSLTGTPSDAQTILSSFATALVSLTTLVLTVTLVAVQLAMGQFSPRMDLKLTHSASVQPTCKQHDHGSATVSSGHNELINLTELSDQPKRGRESWRLDPPCPEGLVGASSRCWGSTRQG